MNLVGKIFVFLIFSMSVVFMSFAVMIYATHTNWKDEVLRTERGKRGEKIGWKKRLETEEHKNIQLQSQKRGSSNPSLLLNVSNQIDYLQSSAHLNEVLSPMESQPEMAL